jgi:23S rRNA (cytidine1920-2'-O)/16S rRNA (cytidine1409-2'-O)-methyltransferase
MAKARLDNLLYARGHAYSRAQALTLVKLGKVKVDGKLVQKPGQFVAEAAKISVYNNTYVSRAAYKLESVAVKFGIDFADKTVLDVGSSTGGFTDFALKGGAKKSICVEVGTNQLHPTLHGNPRIELHEKTDIRDFQPGELQDIDIVVIDVSFISLRDILPHIKSLVDSTAIVVAMAKPQFEAGHRLKNNGVIKNEKLRREILNDLEVFMKKSFVVLKKADSDVEGKNGNLERFYLLQP